MAFKSIRINGKIHYGQYDYRPTPPTLIKHPCTVTYSSNPGTLVLSGFENRNLDEIQIKEGSKIDIGDICLYVAATKNKTENEIVLMVTDYASMQ